MVEQAAPEAENIQTSRAPSAPQPVGIAGVAAGMPRAPLQPGPPRHVSHSLGGVTDNPSEEKRNLLGIFFFLTKSELVSYSVDKRVEKLKGKIRQLRD